MHKKALGYERYNDFQMDGTGILAPVSPVWPLLSSRTVLNLLILILSLVLASLHELFSFMSTSVKKVLLEVSNSQSS